jgi:hypothetical protein
MFEAPTSTDVTENLLVEFLRLDGLVELAKEEDARVVNKLVNNILPVCKI